MKRRILIVSYNLTDSSIRMSKFLENQPQWLKILNSTWLIATSETPKQFYNRLEPYLDKNNDRLFISEITNDYQGWLPRRVWDWIKLNQT